MRLTSKTRKNGSDARTAVTTSRTAAVKTSRTAAVATSRTTKRLSVREGRMS